MRGNCLFEKPTDASSAFPISTKNNFPLYGEPEKSYISNHYHNELEFFFMSHGSAIITLDDVSHYIEADQFILILPGTAHSVHSVDTKPFFYHLVNFDIKILKNNAKSISDILYYSKTDNRVANLEYIIKKDSQRGKLIIELFRMLVDLLKKKPFAYEVGVMGYLDLIIFNIINSTSVYENENKTNTNELQPALEYIANNYMHPISLDTLANISAMSKYYFIRLFSKTFGMTPIEYINKVRMDRACDLLASEEDMRILEIALAVGFNDLSYFNRLFKRIVGIPPAKYRQHLQNQKRTQPLVLFGEAAQAVPFYKFML